MFRTQRERDFILNFGVVVGVFQLRDRSAIYSAPGGANGFEPNERLHPFDPTVTTVGYPTDAPNSHNYWLSNWFATFGRPTGLTAVGGSVRILTAERV